MPQPRAGVTGALWLVERKRRHAPQRQRRTAVQTREDFVGFYCGVVAHKLRRHVLGRGHHLSALEHLRRPMRANNTRMYV